MRSRLANQNIRFLLWLLVLAVACCIRLSDGTMLYYNTTLFAMNYSYGFISRGLLGTVFSAINQILPIDIMNFAGVFIFSGIMLLFYMVTLFFFYKMVLELTRKEDFSLQTKLIVFLSVFAFTQFLSESNWGRLDLLLYTFSFLSVICILKDRLLFLVPVFTVLSVLIHQGYVFTNAALILVVLFYLWMMRGEKKYRRQFFLNLILMSGLFLYFEFFSHAGNADTYSQIVAQAKALSPSGKDYNSNLLEHEWLGLDMFETEYDLHIYNYKTIPVFLVFFFPYWPIALGFMKRLLKNEKGNRRLSYLAVCLGGLTYLPEIIMKVDYARYAMGLFCYYISVIIVLVALGDEKVLGSLRDVAKKVRTVLPFDWILILYPLLFMPFDDVIMGDVIDRMIVILWP